MSAEKAYYDMMNLQSALSKVQNESGRNNKETLLGRFEDVPYFKETMGFLYNNLIVTGISKAKLADERGQKAVEGYTQIKDYSELLNYLSKNSTGRLVDLSSVNSFITNFEGSERKMLEGIVTKDIPLGLSGTTLNKVYGKGFVPKFDVMKGTKFDPTKHTKDGNLPVTHAITEKYDGLRCLAIIDHKGQVTLMARSGKEHTGYTELIEDIKALEYKNVVFDGEILAKNPNGLKSDELFSVTSSITRKKGEKTGLNYWIYDTLSYDEFLEGKSGSPYELRRGDLSVVEDKIAKTGLLHLHVSPVLAWTKNMDVVQKYIDFAAEEGKEGIMLNSASGFYTTTRTKQLLKVKQFHTADVLCTDVVEEIRGGKLGAIVVDYKGSEVKVGSGFSAEERQRFWDNPDEIIGKIVEIQYFEESRNQKDDSISLRFPTFKRVRQKDEVSYH